VSDYTNARHSTQELASDVSDAERQLGGRHSDVKINGQRQLEHHVRKRYVPLSAGSSRLGHNLMTDVPKLLKWVEDNFVNVSTPDGLSGQYYGAYVPPNNSPICTGWAIRQQTGRPNMPSGMRLAAIRPIKDRAYRCLSYNTYMMQDNGQSSMVPRIRLASGGPTATARPRGCTTMG